MRSKEYYDKLLSNPNVQRGLAVIRATEGTARYNDPYAVAFGGRKFDPTSGHPRQLYSFRTNTGKPQKTSAAGAYQFLSKTWQNVAKALDLKDMSPRNQDIAAIALIDGRNGLKPLVDGDIKTFVKKVGPEWASLPTAPKSYDQPTKSWSYVQDVWDSAPTNNYATQPELASLPEPATRPVAFDETTQNTENPFNGLLATPAHAGRLTQSDVGLLERPSPVAPSTGLLASQYNQYQPAKATQSTAGYMAQQQAKVAANELSQLPEQAQPSAGMLADQYAQYQRGTVPQIPQANNFDARFNAPVAEPATQAGILAPDPQTTASVTPKVAANPESMTPEEFQVYQEDLAMSQPVLQPEPPLNATPLTAYTPQAQPMASPFDTAPMAPTNQAPAAPPPPRGNDVWNGQAMSGVANGGYELNRQANGDVYRYSPEYNRTDILDASGGYKSQQKGRIDGPVTDTIEAQPKQGFSNPISPAQTNLGNTVRGVAGSVAGGMAGSLLGPAGGLIGSLLGARIAQGKGLLGSQMTPARGVAVNQFPNAPTINQASNVAKGRNNSGGRSYNDMRNDGFSDRVSTAASQGKGGLF